MSSKPDFKEVRTPPRSIDPIVEAILAQKPNLPVADVEAEVKWRRELLARVQVIREGKRKGINDIRNRNPEYVYCWVYNDAKRVQEYESDFYEIVSKNNDDVETNFERNGHHIKGDSILMRVKRDLADAMNAERDLKAIEALEGKYAGIEGFAASERIPFFRKS